MSSLGLLKQTVAAGQQQSFGRVGRYVMAKGLGAVLRRTGRPGARLSLRDIGEFADRTTSPEHVAEQLVGGSVDMTEAWAVVDLVNERTKSVGLSTPSFRTEQSSLAVLYTVVRALHPGVVLETGVADGLSTAVILAALDANDHGRLHSVDIAESVGRIARAGNTDRWELHVHAHVKGEADMRDLVARLDPVDIYYHDSGHSWLWQTFEYETITPIVTNVVLSDDIDASWAFAEHCAAVAARPVALVESTKVFGGYRIEWSD